ncbi:MAG TPA: low affinity iron permease family protein [Tepidisphaeraceae bacterium]|jgi:low affinity Fe/Cu permease
MQRIKSRGEEASFEAPPSKKQDTPPSSSPPPPPREESQQPARPEGFREWFRHFAHLTASAVGSAWAFAVAALVIVGWAASGPFFRFSDTWQLVINTGTTIVTFLMVFLIQNTQNRDARAMHLKLDELIRALHGARNRLVDLEELSDKELDDLEQEFQRVRNARDDVDTSEADQ